MPMNQRMRAAFQHIEPDRTPFFEYVLLSPLADRILRRQYTDYAADTTQWYRYAAEVGWEQAVRQHAADKVALAKALGHDLIYLMPNPMPQDAVRNPTSDVPESHGAKPGGPLGGDPVKAILKRNRLNEAAYAAPAEPDQFFVYELIEDEMNRQGLEAAIMAPAYAHGVWTDVELMQTMILEPEIAHRHFELATKHSLRLIEQYMMFDIDLIGVGGDFAGNRPIISPEAYREFIVPQVRTLSDRIHQGGKYSINASDGNLWPVIDDYLTGCGVDGYLEIDANAGMGLKPLKERFGRTITFLGNMDCGQMLSFASPEGVRRAAIQCLEDGMGRGGHVFCASNAITSSVPMENYLAMVNAYKDFFGLQPVRIG